MGPGTAFALLDDDAAGAGGCRLFTEPLGEWRCDSAADLSKFFRQIEAVRAEGLWIVLAADYEAGLALEPRLRPLRSDDGKPLIAAQAFRRMELLDGGATEAFLAQQLERLGQAERIAGVFDLRPSQNEAAFSRSVERIREYIRDGDCYQVNLTFALEGGYYGHPLVLYARLRAAQPVRYGGYVCLGGRHILSVSPELFLERRGARLLTRPMKGTARRSNDPIQDDAARQELSESDKNRAENVMIVDLLRNDLGRLARPGSVRVEKLCDIEAYPTVFQMVSEVSAEVGTAPLEAIFRALFPCGSITGAPKIRAMEIIRELEAAPRGLYTGSLGWLAPDGDFRLNVAIRTLVLQGQRASLGIGAGIVLDSTPEAEWAECWAKARFLTDLKPPLRLIESLRLEAGQERPYPLLETHLERLRESARVLGFALDEGKLRQALLAHAAAQAPGVYKTRLKLHADGHSEIESSPLGEAPAATPRVMLAQETIRSDDPLLRHKTSARHVYDQALARLPAGVFDLIFQNERGELCEGARSNLYLQLDGRLYTPPESCGLLNGVQRRLLLKEGRVEERVLYPDDLRRAEAVYLSNAVRGMFRVTVE